jgi:hypothetical protein
MFKRSIPVLLTLCVVGICSSTPASATVPAPGLTIESFATPTNFTVGGELPNSYRVRVTNAGSVPTSGEIVLADTPPPGVQAESIEFHWSGLEASLSFLCNVASVSCRFPEALKPDETLTMNINVTPEPGAPEPLINKATVTGGGAPAATTESTNAVSSSPAPFGASNFSFFISGLDGAPDTQAGGHPYELTTTIGLNNSWRETALGKGGEVLGTGKNLTRQMVQDVKDIVVDLPLGFVGSTLAAPECRLWQLTSGLTGCPASSIVGHIRTEPVNLASVDSPIFNVTPDRGFPAQFAYFDSAHGSHPLYTRVVPTAGGYVLQVTSPEIPTIDLTHIVATFYGDPAAKQEELEGKSGNRLAAVPYFTNPTDCAGKSLVATMYLDSWENPGSYNPDGTPNFADGKWVKSESVSPPMIGCNGLSFAPELFSKPTTEEADSPSGMELEMKFPQSEAPDASATSELRNATVTFPPGFTLDPSSGDGLAACSEAQIGWRGGSLFNFTPAPAECPEASKVGSLEVTTPLLPNVLHGAMYVATQDENPYGSVIGLYVVVQDPTTGVLIKLAGRTVTNPQTGQITGIFEENPQFPINELKLSFFGGPRAEFATPDDCGSFQTTSDLEPWSAPDSGPNALPFGAFPITTGCVSGFSPAFTASDTNLQAGAYSPFVASFSREDTDQELGGLSVDLPPGLVANLSGVALCGEAQANAGTCPEASQIGTVLAESGPGPNPLANTGKAYLTGPYNGGSFGMSVVVPAVAGPFNFGNVVVRQSLRIDPSTAQVSVVSNPFPTILNPKTTNSKGEVEDDGIPIRLRRVQVRIERPGGQGFTFNPTNCNKLQVGGTITSTQSETKALERPFQVTNCASLKFTPKFSVSTSGKTSKADGASLKVLLSYPSNAIGTQANIHFVKVDLPKQLPSRLTTLQQACTAKQFEANPGGCPAASVVGHAKAITPILPVPLEGPVYFVSHGGEAFPSLIVVLQGYGVSVDLVGTTFISKAGITSSTFKTVPDVPVGSFELTLPQGKYSALAANGNLCKSASKLLMPTAFVAQNGAEMNQSTKIAVTGCATPKTQTRARSLAAALKVCHKDSSKAERAACQAGARRRYGPSRKRKK